MHDLRNLEARNVLSVGVATTEFEQAAKIQNTALGYDAAVVYVPHPIQDRTDAELRALAERAFDAIMASLVSQSK